jgi:dienelactone hydrolase
MEKTLIDQITENRGPHYEPYGWHQWPEHPWLTYQFRRGLGETQEGGGAVSECFLAASRMIPGDKESWHKEWLAIAGRNHQRGDMAEAAGHIQTAKNCWLRAADYYRQAEFFLAPDDPRRLATFEEMEACSRKFIAHLVPPGEAVRIPYENATHLDAYFVPAPFDIEKKPVLISFGGLDSIKDEMWFMTGRGALQRGISMLMVDGPGQGGPLRRQNITTRHDYEVPVGACIDYLETRADVDPGRIAVSGSSLGGYYSARAGSYEHRLAATISHGAIWSVQNLWGGAGEAHGLATHIKWVFGARTMKEALDKAAPFTVEGALEKMRCPYLIIHGGYDVLGVAQARRVHDYAKSKGVNVTLKMFEPDETGAEHCQHDNPTIGQEYMADWLADIFGIDQRDLMKKTLRPIY